MFLGIYLDNDSIKLMLPVGLGGDVNSISSATGILIIQNLPCLIELLIGDAQNLECCSLLYLTLFSASETVLS